MLEFKAERYGRIFQRTGPSCSSSQDCSNPACHRIDGPKPLKVRTWTCEGCGTVHVRDINAARNTRQEGTRLHSIKSPRDVTETPSACGTTVRPGT